MNSTDQSYTVRPNALTSSKTYRIEAGGLVVADEAGPPRSIPWAEITAVDLVYAATRYAENRYLCHLQLRSGAREELVSCSYEGFANFRDQAAAFNAFVRSLHATLAAQGTPVRFGREESSWVQRGRQAVTVGLIVMVIAIAVVILGLTGLVLWNPIAVTSVVSGEVVPIAQSVHSNHALLTMGSLLLLRIGIVLFWRPRRKDLFENVPEPTLTAEQAAARRRRYLPAAIILAVAIAGGLFLFLTSEQTAIDTVPRQRAVIFAPQVLPDEGDPHIGEVLWGTLRCAFCHGTDANGGAASQPSLHREDLTFEAFFQQVRVGRGDMPAFTAEELPDGYLVHLWAWLQQSVATTGN